MFELWEATHPTPEMRAMNRFRYGHPWKWARRRSREDAIELMSQYLMAWTEKVMEDTTDGD